MSDPFATHVMALTDSAGNLRAQHLDCQVDNVNLPWNMEGANGLVPTDWYDLYSIGWSTPIPSRGDYFVVEADTPTDPAGTKFSMFSTVYVGPDTVQVRVAKYGGQTP